MEQAIIDALILKLYELFPNIKAYDEKMEMQVEPPMFQISCYQTQRTDRITQGGFFYTYFFEILYFPGNDEPEEKAREIELELTNAVWRFGHYRGDDIRTTRVAGVLHTFFSITLELKEEQPAEPVIEETITEVKVNGKQVSSETN